MQFLSNVWQNSWFGKLTRVNKEKLLLSSLSEEIDAVFNLFKVLDWRRKTQIFQKFPIFIILFSSCRVFDRHCELERWNCWTKGNFVLSEGFCEEIKTICYRKSIILTQKLSINTKLSSFVVLRPFLYNCRKISRAASSKTFEIERTSYAVLFLTRTLQRFASETVQTSVNNSSLSRSNFRETSSRVKATILYVPNCFGVSMLENIQIWLTSKTSAPFRTYLPHFGREMVQNWQQQTQKCPKCCCF